MTCYPDVVLRYPARRIGNICVNLPLSFVCYCCVVLCVLATGPLCNALSLLWLPTLSCQTAQRTSLDCAVAGLLFVDRLILFFFSFRQLFPVSDR